MINKNLAKRLLDRCLTTGADFAELFIEKTHSENIMYDNLKVDSIGSSYLYGIGIRIIKGLTSVYGHSNDIKESSLNNLIDQLKSRFTSNQESFCKEFKTKKFKNINPIDKSYFDTPQEDKIKILDLTSNAMKNYSPLIVRTLSIFSANRRDIEIFNSNGLHVKDSAERVRLVLEAFSSKDDHYEMGFDAPGLTGGINYFNTLDLVTMAKDVAKVSISLLDAKDCPSGKMTVIIGSGFGGTLFHEACGHSLESTAVSKNMSVFANKLGQKIASDIVTAYDDGTMKNMWGSNNVDDEGQKCERTCLIKNGILMNYLIDPFNGRRMKMNSNGCSRRQNYTYEPTSRMSNTYIDNGKSTVDELITNTKLGLYAKKLGGGSVNPVNGEFEFACQEAYIIRDGKICEQVRGATLIGTGEEVLKNIDMIANDLDFDTGYCGSVSGAVPVTTGQPTIRIKEMLVGGNGGKLN